MSTRRTSTIRRTIGIAAASFVAMEGVSYAAHRWVMHGPGMRWHASHHAPSTGRYEANDLYPLVFSGIGVSTFALAHSVPRLRVLWPIAAGITAYGAAYMTVHELYIHRRAPIHARLPASRYADHLRRAHGDHHVDGGEPFGMLLPIGRRRHDDRVADPDAFLERRSTVAAMRARL
jgi:beta-carotene 3-hydroxylase